MSAELAKDYLKTAVETETGRDILRTLGMGVVIKNPTESDDESLIIVAAMVRREMARRYGI